MEQLNNLPGLPRCPVCYEVIHEPVVFPCEHEVCLACFTKSLETGNLCCPLCRKRISSWARRNARNPVCSKRKRQIEEVVAHFDKENVCSVDSSQADIGDVKAHQCLSKPGEIKEEYLTELQKIQKENYFEESMNEDEARKLQYEEEQHWQKLETERREEEQLGEATARCLEEEEHEQVKYDEEMAEVLSQDFILKQIVVQQKQVEKDRQLARKLSIKGSLKTSGALHLTSPETSKRPKMGSPSIKPITCWLRPTS